jgi:hypothetical protein
MESGISEARPIDIRLVRPNPPPPVLAARKGERVHFCLIFVRKKSVPCCFHFRCIRNCYSLSSENAVVVKETEDQ